MVRRWVKQVAKSTLIDSLDRRGLQIVADPFAGRLVRMLAAYGIDVVIDGGANSGQFAGELRRAGFGGQLISLEPLGDAYRQLSRRATGDALWQTEHAALSDREGHIDINVAGNSESSSVLPMLEAHLEAAPNSGYVAVETTRCTTVDALVAELGLEPERTLLKLDVQGYEHVVLRGASETLKTLKAMQLELSFVPLYEDSQLAHQVVDFASQHGFTLWMLDPSSLNHPDDGRLLQCDGVFLRE